MNKKERNINDLFKLSKDAIDYFRWVQFENIFIELKIRIGDREGHDPSFEITVYDKDADNVSFDYYSFYNDNPKRYEKDIQVIKSGDFEKIKDYHKSLNTWKY